MCLKKAELILNWSQRRKFFFGIGYKVVSDYYTYGRNKWSDSNVIKDKRVELDSEDTPYRPGFHIFLNKKDAIDYGYEGQSLYEVEFRDILAFGINECGMGYGPCVVADKIRLKRKIGKLKYNGEIINC